jgi:hypothetical protein
MDRQISLLFGFDIMRSFFQKIWEEDEKHSDDLAGLLGSMDRDEKANGQPLDIGQWTDWLDAVLVVRSDLSALRDARTEMQGDHQEFLEALKIQRPKDQRKALNELRAKAANTTWHRVGHHSIGILEAYEAMRIFLRAYWERSGKTSRDIGMEHLAGCNACS